MDSVSTLASHITAEEGRKSPELSIRLCENKVRKKINSLFSSNVKEKKIHISHMVQ